MSNLVFEYSCIVPQVSEERDKVDVLGPDEVVEFIRADEDFSIAIIVSQVRRPAEQVVQTDVRLVFLLIFFLIFMRSVEVNKEFLLRGFVRSEPIIPRLLYQFLQLLDCSRFTGAGNADQDCIDCRVQVECAVLEENPAP